MMRLSITTRPGISHAMLCCGTPFSQPHQQALESKSKDNGTPSRDKGYEIGLCEGFGIGFGCVESDADYADTSNDRRSASGTVVTLGVTAVNWVSNTQRCVTLSTTEAEYVTLGEGVNISGVVYGREIVIYPAPS